MIIIKKKNNQIYFKLIIIYWYSFYRFQIITQDFDSNDYSRNDIRKIQYTIKSELNKRFK